MPRDDKNAKIAFIGHKRVPSREGGVEIVAEELSVRMASRGLDVTLYNRRGHHISGKDFDNKKLKEYKGVHIKSVFTINKAGLAAMTSSFFASLRAAFSSCKIVHYHAEGPCAMMWIPKLFGKRCVATIHGLDHKRAKWGNFASSYIKFGEKCAVKFADEIIVLSENLKNYFLETYGRETVYIPNGISKATKCDPQLITEKYGLIGGDYILFLGRIVPEKGISYLIDAFKSVETDKKLVIAGGASDTDEYMQYIKAMADSDDRIIFTNFVEGRLLAELYSNAYIYTLPSDLEGMPLSLLEAMSYGNCCLTSDIPECAEVVSDKGFTFKKSSIADLNSKLQYLCDNPQTVSDFSAISADYICSKYNWDDVVQKTLSLYNIPQNMKPTREEKYENFAHK